MIARIFETKDQNPYRNLALEQYLMEAYPGDALLMLWQNAHTVVIGAGQNAWAECRAELLKEEGGRVARRMTGGGAVYHDGGNVNFSFIMPPEVYDVKRQLGVVLAALRAQGLDAQFSGRNDLTIDRRKFSGNAFRRGREAMLHHGTVMVNLDVSMAARYLVMDPDKQRARGVKSVPARVVNLAELAPGITVGAVWDGISAAFAAEYGAGGLEGAVNLDGLNEPRVLELTEKYASWDWVFGETPRFDARLKHWFEWGGVTLDVQLHHGAIAHVSCYSDAMDETLAGRVCQALDGCMWRTDALAARAEGLGGELGADIAGWLGAAEL